MPWEILEESENEVEKIYSILEKNKRLDFLKSYEIFVNYIDDDNMLKKINVNTLIVTGENDAGSTPEMSKNLSKMISGSNFIEIKKEGFVSGARIPLLISINY